MNRLGKSVSFLALTRAVEFAVGLVRVKLNSVILGVTGVGIVEQMAFFAQQLSTFTLFSMSEGFVKQIASSEGRVDDEINKALKAYLVMVAVFMSMSVSVTLIFYLEITPYIFGSVDYLGYYLVAVACLPVLVLNSIPYALLKAFKATVEIGRARIVISVINLLLLVPLVSIFKLQGAVTYLFFSYVVALLVNGYFSYAIYLKKYSITLRSVFGAQLTAFRLKELLTFSGFGLTVGVFFIVTEMYIRSIIVGRLGVEAIGVYSPVIMWASIFTGVVLPTFSTYLYPRFCESVDPVRYSELINSGLRLASFCVLPLLLVGVPFKNYFIALLYSGEFTEANNFVSLHFFGLIFYSWWYVYSQSFTPSGRIKLHGSMLVLMYSLNVIIVYFFIDSVGLYAYALKYFIPSVILFLIYGRYASIKMGVRLSKSNVSLMVYVVLCGCLIGYLDYIQYDRLIKFLGLLLVSLSFILLNAGEKEYLKLKLSRLWLSKGRVE